MKRTFHHFVSTGTTEIWIQPLFINIFIMHVTCIHAPPIAPPPSVEWQDLQQGREVQGCSAPSDYQGEHSNTNSVSCQIMSSPPLQSERGGKPSVESLGKLIRYLSWHVTVLFSACCLVCEILCLHQFWSSNHSVVSCVCSKIFSDDKQDSHIISTHTQTLKQSIAWNNERFFFLTTSLGKNLPCRHFD